MTFPSDLKIARGGNLRPIEDIASTMGVGPHFLEHYGDRKSVV